MRRVTLVKRLKLALCLQDTGPLYIHRTRLIATIPMTKNNSYCIMRLERNSRCIMRLERILIWLISHNSVPAMGREPRLAIANTCNPTLYRVVQSGYYKERLDQL